MTTSNSKFRTGSKEAPTEPFKRAVTSCLRAIAKAPELEVTFAADDGALTMTLSVADPSQQERMQHVIDDHLKRFAFREELDIVWTN